MPEKLDFKKSPKTRFKDVETLSKKEAREEVEALREGIDYHDYLYYVKAQPKISDAVYDRLFKRLQELEEAFPELSNPSSPTRRVGAEPVDELKSVEHEAPMRSLNAALEEDEVNEFDDFVRRRSGRDSLTYVLEPKFDGVSVELVYEQGEFVRGVTRGDGRTGEDISENLKTIGAVPLRLQAADGAPERLAVRGEVLLPKEGFQEMNRRRVERDQEPFANPRNAAAGILKRLASREVAEWPLDVIFYDVLAIEGREFETHREQLKQLAEWGLKTDSHVKCGRSLKTVREFHRRLEEDRDELPFEIDGIVIKVDDLELQQQLGTRHRSPRWALAWKFPPRKEVTVLKDIVVQVGMTGMLTPVALLEPVDVGGVTVSRATLHNEDDLRRKDVRPGDKVRIARAGDVIPEVVERIRQPGRKRSREFSMPKKCPVCGSKVVREGAYYFCPAGLSCPPQLIGHVIHYGSREALDIDGLGEETVRELVERGMVQSLADLYDLTADDLKKLEGFAEKSARKLHQAIQDTKQPRLDRFLYALGIRHVGRRVARVLADQFGSLDALRTAGEKKLAEAPEVGPEIASSVHRFFTDPANGKTLDRLRDRGVEVQDVPQKARRPDAGKLKGRTFVFTGELEGYTRAEAEEAVERLGGRATSSVSSRTDYVVVGKDPGSKLDEARQEGVETIDERQFQELLKAPDGLDWRFDS